MTAPINNYPYNNLENIMALSKSIREGSANVTSNCDLNTQDTVTLSDTTKLTEYKVPKPIKDNEEKISEYKVPKPIKDNGKKGIEEKVPEQTKDDGEQTPKENFEKITKEKGKQADIASAAGGAFDTVLEILKEATEAVNQDSSGDLSGDLYAKLKFLAEKYPKIVKRIISFGQLASPVLNALSGYLEGEKVASKHYNENTERNEQVYNRAVVFGALGALSGAAAGAVTGAIAGSAICPGFGTVVGVIVGFVASNYLSSKGAEIGAEIAKERYDRLNKD